MLQNWLKPIKGHNGRVPALNIIPEPDRNRVKLELNITLGSRKTGKKGITGLNEKIKNSKSSKPKY